MPRMNFRTIAKPQNYSKTLKRTIKDFKNEKFLIIIVIMLSIFSAILTIYAPIVLQDFLNSALSTNSDMIKIIHGTFANVDGKIISIDKDAGTVRVETVFFGRVTPVDVEFSEIIRQS